jgi:formylglycine-generating enzyme required for sulfatase activity
MEFVKIEPGTFLMGCPQGNMGCDGDERPPATDPTGPAGGSERVPRGGSWMSTSPGIGLPNRNLIEPADANFNIGFRCVREPV